MELGGEAPLRGRAVIQRPVLYLGEINAQCEARIRTIKAFVQDAHCRRRLTLFASDRKVLNVCFMRFLPPRARHHHGDRVLVYRPTNKPSE